MIEYCACVCIVRHCVKVCGFSMFVMCIVWGVYMSVFVYVCAYMFEYEHVQLRGCACVYENVCF